MRKGNHRGLTYKEGQRQTGSFTGNPLSGPAAPFPNTTLCLSEVCRVHPCVTSSNCRTDWEEITPTSLPKWAFSIVQTLGLPDHLSDNWGQSDHMGSVQPANCTCWVLKVIMVFTCSHWILVVTVTLLVADKD